MPLSRRQWVPLADIPYDASFERIYRQSLSSLPGGFVLHGCNTTVSRFLLAEGCQVAQTGVEAVLNLEEGNMAKPSVLDLARRGGRWGRVMEVLPTEANQHRLAQLAQTTAHGAKPQLQYAFRTQFDEATRGFVFATPEGKWLAAITLSLMKPNYWHTELLLRRKSAPIGVMEALVTEVFDRLKKEGGRDKGRWSLGMVPFLSISDPLLEQSCKNAFSLPCRNELMLKVGRLLHFSFNYEGLFRFKDKFSPEWRPLYLCGKPTLPWRVLIDLSIKSRHLHLLGYGVPTWFRSVGARTLG
ncbi:MAG TPA: DUF2156 domain-containing protein [Caldilineae bacterium]|nr:DUF2156 domain-containing protein [Caldilineae bacterium]